MLVLDELNAFAVSLSGLAYKTRSRYLNHLELYLNWLAAEDLHAGQVRTVDILAFIDHQKQNYSPEQQHRIIHSLTTWYTQKGYQRNPASGIKIRYRTSKLNHELLDRKALNKLHHSYEATTIASYRNKVIIGLLVFQGLTSGEIKRLQVDDIHLEKGQIYIRSTRQTNSRTLPLAASQILEMKTYLEELRPQFGKPTKQFIIPAYRTGRHRKGTGTGIQNVLNHLFTALKKQHPKVRHAGQLRQSVITEWLKEKDVRVVQYLAGHKNVKSTEQYATQHLEDLKAQLNKFHPLGNEAHMSVVDH